MGKIDTHENADPAAKTADARSRQKLVRDRFSRRVPAHVLHVPFGLEGEALGALLRTVDARRKLDLSAEAARTTASLAPNAERRPRAPSQPTSAPSLKTSTAVTPADILAC